MTFFEEVLPSLTCYRASCWKRPDSYPNSGFESFSRRSAPPFYPLTPLLGLKRTRVLTLLVFLFFEALVGVPGRRALPLSGRMGGCTGGLPWAWDGCALFGSISL